MADLSRIGVAIDSKLLEQFDNLIAKRGYTNRSEAFRDLIRNELVQETWQASESVVFGTVTLVYDHHVRQLTDKLTELQHGYFSNIVANMHVHLDHHNCLEVILIRGKSADVQKLANSLIAMKGVKHGRLTATAA
jgi:CopG family nickel-responsive transcriptional regulator